MAIVQIAHSIVAGHTPTLTHAGQLGINEPDGLLFARDGTGATFASCLNMPATQCQLRRVNNTTLTLFRKGGNYLYINGHNQLIPSAGVTLGVGGLSAGVFYYIYAFMSGSTMTLEGSATGYTLDATSGLPLKTADATRTLVGAVTMDTGPVFTDSNAKRYVASYWNRRHKQMFTGSGSNPGTIINTYAETDTAWRAPFITWNDEAIFFSLTGWWRMDTTNRAYAALFIDATGTNDGSFASFNALAVNTEIPVAVSFSWDGISEGVAHFVNSMFKRDAGGTLLLSGYLHGLVVS